MKRFLSAALCLLLTAVLGFGVFAADEDPAVLIKDRAGLEAIAENPGGRYRLGANIDLSGKDWVPIPFSGTFDGDGYTLYNLHITAPSTDVAVTIDGNKKPYDTVFASLFSIVKDAEIHDLHILGADITVETDQHCYTAILAGFIENTKISDCSVQGRVRLYSTNIMEGVSGVAGFGKGQIKNCKSDVELTFADRRTDHKCEFFMGAILANGNADMIGCNVSIDGYGSCQGYVHSGGMNGMFYRYDDSDPGMITGNHVEGKITFFENNPDRRAYCKPYGGELLSKPSVMNKNSQKFTRNEVMPQKDELRPEKCSDPKYEDTVTEPGCENWGFTLHTCTNCGYEYCSDYRAPVHQTGDWEIIQDATYDQPGLKRLVCSLCGAVVEEQEIAPHVAGDWLVTQEPDYGTPGLRQRFCTDCQVLLEEETIPALIPVTVCDLSTNALSIPYKGEGQLTVDVQPSNAYDLNVIWSSSDESVVTVDQNGHLTAQDEGSAIITCSSSDGYAVSTCNVTVDYTFSQWLIVLFLFGWLWY